ncbi:MAG: N-acylneuraminate cytidylyltransferase [Candidatus Peregrinibacteria bacterium Greene0416_19]|nr:MAG: N-acylneuraminate cytidylyltransferase [Candidatus Peregrinibacteria bacterium Greene0416_19]
MEILGIIPARSGSKGIPNKNVAPLGEKPLMAHTCEAAAGSVLGRAILSTDDPAIAALGASLGVPCPFLRPANLAEDATPILPVLQHILSELDRIEGYVPDAIALLQPTSPLRTTAHIDAALTLFEKKNVDTVVSVTEVPHRFSPTSLMQLKDGLLAPLSEGPLVLRRQDKERFYARNGPAILIVRRTVIEAGTLYGDRSIPFVMDARSSVDIDGPDDLAYAEFLLRQR